jgi:heptosyltransferase-1/heptosyltransferase-2
MRDKINIKEINSILVYSLNYIGDTLFTTPIFAALKRLNPSLKISTIVGNKGGYYILKDNPYIDDLIIISGTIFDKINLLKKTFSKLPDAVIVLESSFESALICFILGIKYRIGISEQYRSLLLTHKIKKDNSHKVDEYFSNLSVFSNDVKNEKLFFSINYNDFDIKSYDFESISNNRVGIVIGTTNNLKKYSEKNYISLIDLLLRQIQCDIFLIGGDDTIETTHRICESISNPLLHNLSGKTKSLSELGYVLTNMNIVIGSDTGPLHLANALNVPAIFLFRNLSYSKKTGPYNKQCSIALIPENKKIFSSVNKIKPENIYEHIRTMLNFTK